MNSKLFVSALAAALLATLPLAAQRAPAPEVEASSAESTGQVEPSVVTGPYARMDLRLELEAINRQQHAANALYVVSTIFAVMGTGAIFGSLPFLFQSGDTFAYLVNVGAALNVGHVVMMVIGACLDYGSGSHRRKLLRDHPDLALELSPGPGDAGLGVTLRF